MLETLVAVIAMNVPNVAAEREWLVGHPVQGSYSRIVREAATPPDGYESFVTCVLKRESGATLEPRSSGKGALNRSSGAAGRWQFLPAWQHGLPYMVKDRLVQFGMPKRRAQEVRVYLSAMPINQWPGWYQDIGAFEVLERGGRHHWYGGGHRC